MRLLPLLTLVFLALPPLTAQTAATQDEKDAIAAAQRLFNAMAAHDGPGIQAAVLPDGMLYAVRDTGAPTATPIARFVAQVAGLQGDIVERFTAPPTVSLRGKMAQVWGEYEFLRDGKFSHCGVDSFSLFKTDGGWKVAAISYTAETKGCKGH